MLSECDLNKYQLDYIERSEHVLRHMLMADMGLGKTVMLHTCIQRYLPPGRKVLVVCPASVANSVWQDEIDEWSHLTNDVCPIVGNINVRTRRLDSPAQIHILSSNNLLWFMRAINDRVRAGKPWLYDWLVIDECSQFRNSNTRRGKLGLKLVPHFARVTLLTATPVPRDYMNLYQQLKLVDGGVRLGKTKEHYKQKFFDAKFTGNYETLEIKKGAKKKIHKRIRDLCFRYDAKDHLKTQPKMRFNIVKVNLPAKARAIYREIKNEYLAYVGDHKIEAVNDGVRFGKLHQIANGSIYDDEQEAVQIHDAKLARCQEITEELGYRNILISYTHTPDRVKLLASYPGAVHFKGQKKLKDKWNSSPDSGLIFICHPGSMGHGLNLQKGGSNAIFYGIPADFDLYMQFTGRIARQGQKNTCIFHHLLCVNTIDVQIYRTLHRRGMTQKKFLKAMKKW